MVCAFMMPNDSCDCRDLRAIGYGRDADSDCQALLTRHPKSLLSSIHSFVFNRPSWPRTGWLSDDVVLCFSSVENWTKKWCIDTSKNRYAVSISTYGIVLYRGPPQYRLFPIHRNAQFLFFRLLMSVFCWFRGNWSSFVHLPLNPIVRYHRWP